SRVKQQDQRGWFLNVAPASGESSILLNALFFWWTFHGHTAWGGSTLVFARAGDSPSPGRCPSAIRYWMVQRTVGQRVIGRPATCSSESWRTSGAQGFAGKLTISRPEV